MQITGGTILRSPTASVLGFSSGAAKRADRASDAAPSATMPTTQEGAAKTVAQVARGKLDADYAKAITQGTRIVADTAYGGRHLEVSSLTDEELAAVSQGDGFTPDESLTAKAELAGRMWATLAPFESNPRESALAVKAIFPALSPSVRSALGWNEAMLASGDAVVRNFGGTMGKTEEESLLEKLRKTQLLPNALKFDESLLAVRGNTVDRIA